MLLDPKDVKRFWRSVKRGTDCWEWQGHCRPYGRFSLKNKSRTAHRVAWVITHGPIPAGKLVCHRCDNPPCVNPAHLFLGNHSENAFDMVAKGRAARRAPIGELSPSAKLTDEDVIRIRAEYARGDTTYRRLGLRYGVHMSNIRAIVFGLKWRHLPCFPPPARPCRKLTAHDWATITHRWTVAPSGHGGIVARKLAAEYGIDITHVYRIVRRCQSSPTALRPAAVPGR